MNSTICNTMFPQTVLLYICNREYWIIQRGPGFLAVVWYGSSPIPLYPPLPSASCLSFSVLLRVAGWTYWRERRDEVGEEPYHHIIRRRESLVLCKSFNTLCISTLYKTTNRWIRAHYSADFCSESRIGNFQTFQQRSLRRTLIRYSITMIFFYLRIKIDFRWTLEKGKFVYVYESSGVLNYMLV